MGCFQFLSLGKHIRAPLKNGVSRHALNHWLAAGALPGIMEAASRLAGADAALAAADAVLAAGAVAALDAVDAAVGKVLNTLDAPEVLARLP